MSKRNFFTCGPFQEAKQNIQGIAQNMYYSCCFEDAIKKINELEKEYEILCASGLNSLATAEKKDTIELYESVIIRASDMVDAHEEGSHD
jgi:hypothetical protein